MRQRGSIIPSAILVVFGVFLLLDSLNMYIFSWSLFISGAAFLLGLLMLGRAQRTRRSGRAFSGTLLLVLGGFLFLWNYGALDYIIDSPWPIYPTSIGLAFLSMFLVNWRNWWALIPAAPFLALGCCVFILEMGYIDYYTFRDFTYYVEDTWYYIADYYPIVIVLIGLLIIIFSMRHSRRSRRTDLQV
ncbi:hypothetical protein ACFL6I_00520 [candidate division KSB1 bacterium]